jgi:RNA-directed DNA polymerase
MACTTLAHHREVALLERALKSLTPHSAPGVARVPWQADTANLATNLVAFHETRGNDTSGPPPVVRRLLPNSHGTRRPRGLPARADKSVAKAVALLVAALSAQDCCDCSSGFRPGRSPHHARQEGRQGWRTHGMGSVIDGAISAFVDNVPHDTV